MSLSSDGGALGALSGIDSLLCGSDGGAQIIETAALIGWKIEVLQLERNGQQPRLALVGPFERGLGLAALHGCERGIRKQRSGLSDERTRFDLVQALAEQQQESLARAGIGLLRLLRILGLDDSHGPRASTCSDGRAETPRG